MFAETLEKTEYWIRLFLDTFRFNSSTITSHSYSYFGDFLNSFFCCFKFRTISFAPWSIEEVILFWWLLFQAFPCSSKKPLSSFCSLTLFSFELHLSEYLYAYIITITVFSAHFLLLIINFIKKNSRIEEILHYKGKFITFFSFFQLTVYKSVLKIITK